MHQTCPSDGGRRPRRVGRALIAAGLGGLAATAVFTGCSFQKHYGFWSVFIDGIPNPNRLPGPGREGRPQSIRESPTYTAHQPWVERRCGDCHKDRFASNTNLDASICLKCHDDQPDQYPRMHGPVVVHACLWCHYPHESRERWLLKAEPRIVCSQCHQPELLSVARVPEHADETASCVKCHSGHGGNDRFFLRETPLEPEPQPEPTEAAAPEAKEPKTAATAADVPEGR